ncbi:hypothetical protein [Candidatus Amarobacter glycogenicus]|uniref:ParE family toxin-like protein n=1 Tax=Candidatus Amarobacter glycogenicus TaxID=3140699 RepID=UPI003136B293|nr:hypothetical protein [Dehalococcoidia bacterium]MCC6268717.1 hypothetical protein [Dehalococcoidia bacterium]
MNSWREQAFREALGRLPVQVAEQAAAAYRLFCSDPFHPSLQFKSVTASGDLWSVRIGLGYRALGRRHQDTIIWFWIGTHAEYDQLLRRR